MILDPFAAVVRDVIDAVILLFGVGFVWHAASILSHQQVLRRQGLTGTGAVNDDGMVAVEGEIRGPVEDALTSPFERRTGVVAKWSVEEFAGHELGTTGWTEFGSGYEAVPFLVDDGSGPVVVEMASEEELCKLELELADFGDDPVMERDVTEDPPGHVREFVEANDVRDRQPETSVPTTEDGPEQGDRRYYETVLRRGDEVYVVGYAAERNTESWESARAVISPPPESEEGTFYLSDRDRAGALRQRLFRVAVTGGLGILVTWYELANFVPGVRFLQF